jgi:uncharacterized protein YggE
MKQKLNHTVLISIVIIVAGLLIATSMVTNISRKNTISTTGNSQITVDPDLAVIYFNIQTRADSAEDAKDENAEITDAVMGALDALEIKDVETENYNIYPEYDWVNGQREFKGYVATNNIKVSTEEFDDVGSIIDAGVDAGALINYINFELSNSKQNEYKAQVMASASQDARTKAQAVASGLGKNLGEIVSVSASDYNYMPYPIFRAEAGAAVDTEEIATKIEPKKLDVYATVNVEFELK